MPKLVRRGIEVEEQFTWVNEINPAEGLPTGAIWVPLVSWLNHHAACLAHSAPVGVYLQPEEDPALLLPTLQQVSAIAVCFPAFHDGRGYSTARLLRERYGYTGELRAVGDIGQDQAYYLAQVGFDSFAPHDETRVAGVLRGLQDFSDGYQSTWARPLPYFLRRHEKR